MEQRISLITLGVTDLARSLIARIEISTLSYSGAGDACRMRRSQEDGGSVWESNPPPRGLAPITGFEVQAAHQHRYASMVIFQCFTRIDGQQLHSLL
jgi:hypothetical protein